MLAPHGSNKVQVFRREGITINLNLYAARLELHVYRQLPRRAAITIYDQASEIEGSILSEN